MKLKFFSYVQLVIFFFLFSCSLDRGSNISLGDYSNGILILNEGSFNNTSGTINFITSNNEQQSSIFKAVNKRELAGQVESIGFDLNDMAYIVVTDANKIEVVDRFTFNSKATIENGLNNPRYFVISNGKGYVSNWGDPLSNDDAFVAVINLKTFAVENKIKVDFGPEQMSVVANKVYVAHKGAYSYNNKVSIIDSNGDNLEKKLTVGVNPNTMVIDESENLWVMSEGKETQGENIAGELVKINTSIDEVETRFYFEETEHPKYLTIFNDKLYYSLGSDVYQMCTDLDITSKPELFISNIATNIYGMVAHGNKLYITDAINFSSKGNLYVCGIDSKKKKITYTVGVNPSKVYFNIHYFIKHVN